MRPQWCVGNGQQYFHAQREGQSCILPAFGGLVSTSTILNEPNGKIICGGLRRFDAHAEQERSEFSGTGDYSSIQKPYNSHHSQWRNCNL